MISITKRHVYSVALTFSRHYSWKKLKKDPGINKRKAALDSTQEDLQDMELDDLESDFMTVHKSYKQHVDEMDRMNEQLKYFIVKNKYFKEKYPNFLNWTDKEQIKLLHNSDPEEWSVEKLSESFPALPEVIKKILKAKFSKSESKVKKHDAAVEKNWDMFKKENLIDLPPNLVEHLKKFTTRKSNAYYVNKKKEVINTPKAKSEFLQIITSYEKLKKNDYKIENNEHIELDLKQNFKNHKNTKENTFLTVHKQDIKDRELITLTQLESNIKNKANKGQDLTEEEKVIFKDIHQTKESSVVPNQENLEVILDRKYSSGSSLTQKTRDYSHLAYPLKITVPKDLRKKGHTYKLNDCYYDYDGEFLYRVPGMG